jgi:hypothetical protein
LALGREKINEHSAIMDCQFGTYFYTATPGSRLSIIEKSQPHRIRGEDQGGD